MKFYGNFEMVSGDDGAAYFKSGDLDFYEMQADDMAANENPHFDQPCYFVVDAGGHVIMAHEDVGRLVPNGALWGGSVPAEVLAKPGEFTFDGETFTTYEPPHVARRVGTPREFLRLFTDQEKETFFAAARQSVDLEIWWVEASTGDFSLDHQSVEIGLGTLVQSGLLTSERMSEILAADFDA